MLSMCRKLVLSGHHACLLFLQYPMTIGNFSNNYTMTSIILIKAWKKKKLLICKRKMHMYVIQNNSYYIIMGLYI